MDLYKEMIRINQVAGYLMVLVLLLNLATPVYAGTTLSGSQSLETAMKQLCNTARQLLAVGAILLIILAAVVYAVGQVVGAETRARASVWATAMLTGAVIGIIIYLLVPQIIRVISGGGTLSSNDPCSFKFK